jgi:hypothetical protein
MTPFKNTDTNFTDRQIREASDEQLEQWATDDPNPYNKRLAIDALRKRRGGANLESKKQEPLLATPFDPKTDVSADAKYIAGEIVKHLWILFVLLPVIAFLLLGLSGVIK